LGGAPPRYALLSSTNTHDIISNENISGPATITVGPAVKAVHVRGCRPWQHLGDDLDAAIYSAGGDVSPRTSPVNGSRKDHHRPVLVTPAPTAKIALPQGACCAKHSGRQCADCPLTEAGWRAQVIAEITGVPGR
jgi:hypothetical protein